MMMLSLSSKHGLKITRSCSTQSSEKKDTKPSHHDSLTPLRIDMKPLQTFHYGSIFRDWNFVAMDAAALLDNGTGVEKSDGESA